MILQSLSARLKKELVDTVVTAVQGGIFTINEGRAKFNLPSIDEGDNVLVTPGASQMGDKIQRNNRSTRGGTIK